ncbi:MAG: sugar phosphate isomerase/epimerase [Armatimonadetes bacterium]|nr:sugar phosphate isomerase/epimerase [Armatimonadota bacterium]MDW8122360.1 sugar phosphate isomerase/epimerase family protein [Armatimonadota bacterium]
MVQVGCCWLYAISRYGYPPSLSDTFQALKDMARLGFRFAELEGVGEDNLKVVYQNRHPIKNLADDLGIRIVNFCPVLPQVVSLNDQERRNAFSLFDLACECAVFFGCRTIQTDSFTPPLTFQGARPYEQSIDFNVDFRPVVPEGFHWSDQWTVLVESFTVLAEKAQRNGLRFCLEPRVGEMISNTDAALRLFDHAGHPNLGFVLDTAHLHAQKELLPLSVEKLGSRIFYVHLSDNDGRTNEHLGLGRGTIDFRAILNGLKKHQFAGMVGLDLGKIPDLDAEMVRSKEFLVRLLEELEIPYEV